METDEPNPFHNFPHTHTKQRGLRVRIEFRTKSSKWNVASTQQKLIRVATRLAIVSPDISLLTNKTRCDSTATHPIYICVCGVCVQHNEIHTVQISMRKRLWNLRK